MSSTPTKDPKKIKTCLSRKSRKCGRRRRTHFSKPQKTGVGDNAKVSEKLEALKKLIPPATNGRVVKADQLFQDTADYIVLLRTQVLVLHKLIQLYGSTGKESSNVDISLVSY